VYEVIAFSVTQYQMLSNAITFCDRLYQKFTEKRLLRSILCYTLDFDSYIAISCATFADTQALYDQSLIATSFDRYAF